MKLTDHPDVVALIELAQREDLGSADVTTDLLNNKDQPANFKLVAREPCILAGVEVALSVLAAYDQAIHIQWTSTGTDGARIDAPNTDLAKLSGPLGMILSAERVLLNFLQRLCGIATLTRSFVDAVAGTNARILDTRKTTPGWRRLEKYAVRCGGGQNHREGLYDAVLIKDNHIVGIETERLAAAVFDMLNRIPTKGPTPKFIEVEADSIEQVRELFKVVGIDVVLLDNFLIDDLCEAVALREELGLVGKIALEASGGVSLETVRDIADTGVDRISVGALTHSATAIDLALEQC